MINKEDIARLQTAINNYTDAQVEMQLAIYKHTLDTKSTPFEVLNKPAKKLRKARDRLNAWLDKLYADAA